MVAGIARAIQAGTSIMNFIADYMKAIDILALVAIVAIGAASFARTGVVWLLGTAIVLAVWCASRIFGWIP